MRRVLFFALILLTAYLAAMYRFASLLTLAGAELFVFLGAFLLLRLLRRRMRVGLAAPVQAAEKGRVRCPVEAGVRGALPGGAVRVRAVYASAGARRVRKARLRVEAGLRGRALRELELEAPLCGLMHVAVAEARVRDYLSLFSAPLAVSGEEARVAVLPAPHPLRVQPGSAGGEPGEEARPKTGQGSGDVRQVRAYAPGDSLRQIHWNRTAQLDALYVKIRDPEAARAVRLRLDLGAGHAAGPLEMDAFLEVLSALLCGLIAQGREAEVRLCAQGRAPEMRAVRGEEDRRALLTHLCLCAAPEWGAGPAAPAPDAAEPAEDGEFSLGWDLCLRRGGREVLRFHANRYAQEIEAAELPLEET